MDFCWIYLRVWLLDFCRIETESSGLMTSDSLAIILWHFFFSRALSTPCHGKLEGPWKRTGKRRGGGTWRRSFFFLFFWWARIYFSPPATIVSRERSLCVREKNSWVFKFWCWEFLFKKGKWWGNNLIWNALRLNR